MKSVWEQQFLSVDPLPDEIIEDLESSKYQINNLTNILKALEPWTNRSAEDEIGTTGETVCSKVHSIFINIHVLFLRSS